MAKPGNFTQSVIISEIESLSSKCSLELCLVTTLCCAKLLQLSVKEDTVDNGYSLFAQEVFITLNAEKVNEVLFTWERNCSMGLTVAFSSNF